MKEKQFEIITNKLIADKVFEMKLKGDTSKISAPGQFVNIRIDGFYLRRPISVCDIFGDELTLIYKVVGKGTEALSGMKNGDRLDMLTGLGNGYSLDECKDKPLLVGGGVGVPPLYLLAKKLKTQGKDVRVILGFNSENEVFYKEKFEELIYAGEADVTYENKVMITTADGSVGIKGFVTDALSECEYSYVYACGPEPMLKALYDNINTKGQFSFEERMGCGFGACMGCSCKTVNGYKRICKEGPVLYTDEISWQE